MKSQSQSSYIVDVKIKNLKSAKTKAESFFTFDGPSGLTKAEIQANLFQYYKKHKKEIMENLETPGVDSWEYDGDPLWAKVRREVKNLTKNQLVLSDIDEEVLGTPEEQKKEQMNREQEERKNIKLAKEKDKKLVFPQVVTGVVESYKLIKSGNTFDFSSEIVFPKPVISGYENGYSGVYKRDKDSIKLEDWGFAKRNKLTSNDVGKPIKIEVTRRKNKRGVFELVPIRICR